jgi:hypothetical protein
LGSEISGFELFELFELGHVGAKGPELSRPQPFAQVLMPTNDAFAALGNGVITSMVLAPNLEKLRQANDELLRGLAKLAAKSKQIEPNCQLVSF